ncbi:monoheme cytochrome C [Flagellimonas sp.]|uniref:monoheme cytochrome C n=1 Tax=Flagellimonas sp. TaxID=2058762 RepID=UPI003B5CD023
MKNNFEDQVKALSRTLLLFLILLVVLIGGLFYYIKYPEELHPKEEYQEVLAEVDNEIENGIHVATGFIVDDGMQATIQNCTNCHSAKLVTQNRMSKEGWKATIKWMQETQNLWDLGSNEETIVTYLAKNYAPVAKGRRQNLENIDWYELK